MIINPLLTFPTASSSPRSRALSSISPPLPASPARSARQVVRVSNYISKTTIQAAPKTPAAQSAAPTTAPSTSNTTEQAPATTTTTPADSDKPATDAAPQQAESTSETKGAAADEKKETKDAAWNQETPATWHTTLSKDPTQPPPPAPEEGCLLM